ncbi:MAG TPA: hypothetical protein VGM44_03085 [Polyangiaceae bacterium]|jgi:hypothetical protein
MTKLPSRARARRAESRSVWVRWFALLVCVVALVAQTRAASAFELVRVSSSSVVREHVERSESKALFVQASLGVARAPFLMRLPIVPASFSAFGIPTNFGLVARARQGVCAERVTHFHAKRRIPRMNSEEPPRA